MKIFLTNFWAFLFLCFCIGIFLLINHKLVIFIVLVFFALLLIRLGWMLLRLQFLGWDEVKDDSIIPKEWRN